MVRGNGVSTEELMQVLLAKVQARGWMWFPNHRVWTIRPRGGSNCSVPRGCVERATQEGPVTFGQKRAKAPRP